MLDENATLSEVSPVEPCNGHPWVKAGTLELQIVHRLIGGCYYNFSSINPLGYILKKQKSLYKVLTPSINPHINSYGLMGAHDAHASLVGIGYVRFF